jgi:predicted DNA-binding transcriptional regulator AlpA
MASKSKSHPRPAYRTSADDQPIPAALRDHDARVLNVRQWSQLAGFSTRTAKRLFKSGDGPQVVQLSAHRVGVTLAAHKAWVEARTRGAE